MPPTHPIPTQPQKYWDLSTGELLSTHRGHHDYVRCGATNPAAPDVFISGGYDHRLCLWDVRVQGGGGVAGFDHGSPVEACLVLPGGSILVSAGAWVWVLDLYGQR